MRRIGLLMAGIAIAFPTMAPAPGAAGTAGDPTSIEGSPQEVARPDRHPRLDRRLVALIDDPDRRSGAAGLHGYDPATDRVTVMIIAEEGRGPAMEAALTRLGVPDQRRHGDAIAARVPVGRLPALGGNEQISWIAPTPRPVAEGTGEGVATIAADAWHDAGFTGAGVEIAIIDLGFGGYTSLLGSELPDHVATFDECGGMNSGDPHGTAVAEIVHEAAPHASLLLMCIQDTLHLAEAVDLAIARGVAIISHSVGWLNTGRGDGTGPFTGATLQSARDAGILWVNSAGNYAERHWGGTFTDPGANGWHDFAAGPDETIAFPMSPGQTVSVFLKWDDWTLSSNDFDLYLLEQSGGVVTYPDDVVASSIGEQSGSQFPTEVLQYTHGGPGVGTFHLAIQKFAASATPEMDLFVFGAGEPIDHSVPARSLNDLAGSPIVVAAGAFYWNTGIIEPYSSRGPGITGATKPDLAGPDGVASTTYGAFDGTSAAAPHTAAAAALLRDGLEVCSPVGLQAALLSHTDPVGGTNDDYGYGRLLLGTPPASPVPVLRYSGPNRYATAAATSMADFPCGARTVFIATGVDFPDALAGAAVAPRLGAPILLVEPDHIPGETASELGRLAPGTIVILGGESAVSSSVATSLGAYAAEVIRLAGPNRHATAAAISQHSFPDEFPDPPSVSDVFVASGYGFADALAGAPVAASLGAPVLLTDPMALPGETAAEIIRLDPDRIWVLGGPAAVSDTVIAQLSNLGLGIPIERVAGSNRYATAVAASALGFSGPTTETTPSVVHRVYLAVGANFPDALAGGSPAGKRLGPVLLIPSDHVPQEVQDEITRLGPLQIVLLGGTGVISEDVRLFLESLFD